MLIYEGWSQGQFLALLTEVLGAKAAIEIGVFTGYSSLAVATSLADGGRLTACEKDPQVMEVAAKYVQQNSSSKMFAYTFANPPCMLYKILEGCRGRRQD